MVETRWTQGMRAFDEGKRISENPYGTCGPAYREWRNGWYRASDERRATLRERDEVRRSSLDAIGAPDEIANRWANELVRPGRHYHTLDHVIDILVAYEGIGGDDPNIMAAAWLHDIRYDASRTDNEEVSAEIAARDLVGSKVDISQVVEIILDTKYHRGGSPTLDLFSDLDLTILGAPIARYRRYMDEIRAEYHHVPSGIYEPRRAEILRKFNERQIYRTAHFVHLEDRAHANLQYEIEILLGERKIDI